MSWSNVHPRKQKQDQSTSKRVFQAQLDFPSDESWVENVKQDLLTFNINYSFEEIALFTKSQEL